MMYARSVAVFALLVAAAPKHCYAAAPLSEQAAQQLIAESTGVDDEVTWAISQTAHLGGHLKKIEKEVSGAEDASTQYYKLTLRGITESSIVTVSNHAAVAGAPDDEAPRIKTVQQTVLPGLPRFAMLTISTDKNYEKDLVDSVTNPHVVDNILISLELLEMVDFVENAGQQSEAEGGATAVYVARLTKGADIMLNTYNGSISAEVPRWEALDNIDFESGVLVADYFRNPSAELAAGGGGRESLRSLKAKMVVNYIRNIAKIRGSDDDDMDAIVKAQGLLTWWVPIYGIVTIVACCPAAFGFGVTTLPSVGVTLIPAILTMTCCLI